MNPDMIRCATCGQWFNNTDGTEVCPNGHEPQPDSEDECTCLPGREHRINIRRVVAWLDFCAAAVGVVFALYGFVTGDTRTGMAGVNLALVGFAWGYYLHDQAKLADNNATIRMYEGTQLVQELRFDREGLCWDGDEIVEPTFIERRGD